MIFNTSVNALEKCELATQSRNFFLLTRNIHALENMIRKLFKTGFAQGHSNSNLNSYQIWIKFDFVIDLLKM